MPHLNTKGCEMQDLKSLLSATIVYWKLEKLKLYGVFWTITTFLIEPI